MPVSDHHLKRCLPSTLSDLFGLEPGHSRVSIERRTFSPSTAAVGFLFVLQRSLVSSDRSTDDLAGLGGEHAARGAKSPCGR